MAGSKFRIDYIRRATRGIDVGAKFEIYKLINALVESVNNITYFFRNGRVDGYV
jgi:ABC-type sugar transport system ATPase subunit